MDLSRLLLSSALLGSRRRPLAPPNHDHPLAELLNQLDYGQPARSLLVSAALMLIYEKTAPTGQPLQADQGTLDQLLENKQSAAILDWLGEHPPALNARQLSRLLEYALQDSLLSDRLPLHPLNQAFAVQQPAWRAMLLKPVHDDPFPAYFALQRSETDMTNALSDLILREYAAQYVSSPQSVAEGWPSIPIDNRCAILEALLSQLTEHDRPLLELALADPLSAPIAQRLLALLAT